MKKFNPEKELNKIQNVNSNKKAYFLPALLIIFSIITIAGIAYSSSNTTSRKQYTIKLEIINGAEESYIKQVTGGYYEDTIETDATFGSINCLKGNLKYDEETKKVYSENITENTSCILSFMGDGSKEINFSQLAKIYDNDGVSYYYKGNTTENYFKYKNKIYRIVRFNGDGTIRLMLDSSIGSYSYGLNNNYENTNIKNVLNKWYEENFNENDNIVTKEFDLDDYQIINPQNLYIISNYENAKVGLLSVREIVLINGNINSSYISKFTLTSNSYDSSTVWTANDKISKKENGQIYPVINIKYNKLKGRGTEKMPYEIEE